MNQPPTAEEPKRRITHTLEQIFVKRGLFLDMWDIDVDDSNGESVTIRMSYSPIKKIDENKKFRLR
jgi:hypothetical protein